MANSYDRGHLVRCDVQFKNAAGTFTDPTAILFKFRTPANLATTYTYGTDSQLVKDSTGKYHVDLSMTQEGDWYYRFEGTGALQAASEKNFKVRDSVFYTS